MCDADDQLLLALGVVQEADLLQQVVESIGVQYDRHQVGAVALIA